VDIDTDSTLPPCPRAKAKRMAVVSTYYDRHCCCGKPQPRFSLLAATPSKLISTEKIEKRRDFRKEVKENSSGTTKILSKLRVLEIPHTSEGRWLTILAGDVDYAASEST
jgi:hypothetical protein